MRADKIIAFLEKVEVQSDEHTTLPKCIELENLIGYTSPQVYLVVEPL